MTFIGYGIFINGKMTAFYEDMEKCFTTAGAVMPVYVEHKILNMIPTKETQHEHTLTTR